MAVLRFWESIITKKDTYEVYFSRLGGGLGRGCTTKTRRRILSGQERTVPFPVEITDDEAKEASFNLTGFFKLLIEIDREQKRKRKS